MRRLLKIIALFTVFIIIVAVSAFITLTLIVKSEDQVVVPNLVGKDILYTLEFLSDLGLNTKVKGLEYSETVPKNYIISQDPAPGDEIKKGRDVKLIISKGQKTTVVPSIAGLPMQQGRIIMEDNGLSISKLSHAYSSTINKDDIIAQFPSANTQINRGQLVSLLISNGPRPIAFMMPDLIGQDIDKALLNLENSNLSLGKIVTKADKKKPQNTVIGQKPAFGSRVLKDTTIDLAINQLESRSGYAYKKPVTGVHLFRYRLEYGFLKKHIRLKANMFGITADLYDKFVSPGEEVWCILPSHTNVSIFFYIDDELIQTKTYGSF